MDIFMELFPLIFIFFISLIGSYNLDEGVNGHLFVVFLALTTSTFVWLEVLPPGVLILVAGLFVFLLFPRNIGGGFE